MSKQIPEEEIQKVIKMLQESDPQKATRENAVQVIEKMKNLAGSMVDSVHEDLKSGKVLISDDGKISRTED